MLVRRTPARILLSLLAFLLLVPAAAVLRSAPVAGPAVVTVRLLAGAAPVAGARTVSAGTARPSRSGATTRGVSAAVSGVTGSTSALAAGGPSAHPDSTTAPATPQVALLPDRRGPPAPRLVVRDAVAATSEAPADGRTPTPWQRRGPPLSA